MSEKLYEIAEVIRKQMDTMYGRDEEHEEEALDIAGAVHAKFFTHPAMGREEAEKAFEEWWFGTQYDRDYWNNNPQKHLLEYNWAKLAWDAAFAALTVQSDISALVKAAEESLGLMLTGSTCFGMECKYYTECICPDGECQFVLKLQEALAKFKEVM